MSNFVGPPFNLIFMDNIMDFEDRYFQISNRKDHIKIENTCTAKNTFVVNYPSDETRLFYYEAQLTKSNNSIAVGTTLYDSVCDQFNVAYPSSIYKQLIGEEAGNDDIRDLQGSIRIDEPWKEILHTELWPVGRSYTFHGESGKVWNNLIGNICGNPLSINDIIGCGVDIDRNCIFFTYNGEKLDFTFTITQKGPWYPIIGLSGDASGVLLNFGRQPFLYQPTKVSARNFPTPESFLSDWMSHISSSSDGSENGYSDELSDTTLVSKDGLQIKCHRLILSVRSKVLKAMVDPAINEGNVIHVKDFDSKTIRKMLRFIYSDKHPDEDIDMELLALSNYYQLEALQIVCERKLCNELNPSNVIDAWIGADLFERSKFREICATFVYGNWSDLQKTDSYSRSMRDNPGAMARLMAEMLNIQTCQTVS